MLKAGVIGLGVGQYHITGYNAFPGCRVVAACDFSEERLREAGARNPGMRLTTSASEILRDPEINVVSIASYDNYHYEQVMEALRGGKHVFVEKPLVLHENEAREIRKTLNENPNLKLSSNLILRRYPRFIALKELIHSGELGQVYYLEGDYQYGRLRKIVDGWRGSIPYYSVTLGGGIHMVDLLLWLTGARVTEVAAFGNRISTQGTRFKYNDLVAAILKFENGVVAKVSSNFGCVLPHFHAVSVFGTRGTFVNGRESGQLYTGTEGEAFREIKTAYPGAEKGDHLRAFLGLITGSGASEGVAVDEVFSALSICFAIEEALGASQVVKVRYI